LLRPEIIMPVTVRRLASYPVCEPVKWKELPVRWSCSKWSTWVWPLSLVNTFFQDGLQAFVSLCKQCVVKLGRSFQYHGVH